MGCRFESLLETDGTAMSRSHAQSISEEIRELVLDWHNRLSIFDPTSLVSQINRADEGVEFILDDDMFSLILLCEQLRNATNGAFNIAAGTLMNAHGFRSELTDTTHCDHQSLDHLSLDSAIMLNPQRQSIMKSDRRVSLDFGAIGKGYVLDLVREELSEYGVQNAFIHGGTSSILALGHDQNACPWSSQIHDGLGVYLSGFAAGISESNSQTHVDDDIELSHMMDPVSKSPASNSMKKVVCVHSSAAVADAYSTACLVSPELIHALNTEHCTIIAIGNSASPFIHDPLEVVRTLRNTQ